MLIGLISSISIEMSAGDVARSERLLSKIGAALGITEAGKEWLTAAVDPFHDTPLNVCGYPDTFEAASVVQCVKVSANLAVPSGIAGNWDCHIHNFPYFATGAITLGKANDALIPNGSPSGSVTINSTSVNQAYGGITVVSVPAGAATYDTGATGTAGVQTPLNTQIDPYLTNNFRIIAHGYEVINTTSDLNVQGLVTVYRQPSPSLSSAETIAVTNFAPTATPPQLVFGYASAIFDQQPPLNSGSALLLDGSKQWKAKEGAYITSTFNSEDLPVGPRCNVVVTALNPNDTNFSNNINVGVVGGADQLFNIPTTSPIAAIFPWIPQGLIPYDVNASGMYFTGLSNTTTLTLNAVYYIEKFPSQNDTALVVLAKHSCRNDPIARALYSEVMREMPVGVPQRMNGMGEWFADAISSAADFVSPVLSAIPLPMAQTIGGIVKAGGNVAKSLGSKRETVAPYSATGNVLAPKGTVMKAVAKKKKKAKVVVMSTKAKSKK